MDLQRGPSNLGSRAVVNEPNHLKVQALANAWQLASCMRNHLQSAKTANSSPIVFDTLEPAVNICTIIPYYINSVRPKVCTNWLLICNLSMLLSWFNFFCKEITTIYNPPHLYIIYVFSITTLKNRSK